ncbi:hypothetical protein [Oceanobacillus kimchii]|uniref:hypothetical protein n=1 Tax=Oceanobacillus kimchii TaxID=746691 RepID=UPI003B01F7DB
MRNLKTPDLFKIMKIMRKANVKEELISMKPPENIQDEQFGVMLILQFIEMAPQAEREILEFLADVGEVEEKDLYEDEFELLPEIVNHLMKQEKFTNFLSTAFKSATN